MDILGFITLVITGFTSCAEFGSYAFVHPVIRQLPQENPITREHLDLRATLPLPSRPVLPQTTISWATLDNLRTRAQDDSYIKNSGRERRGVELQNFTRCEELQKTFGDMINSILKAYDNQDDKPKKRPAKGFPGTGGGTY